MDLSEDEVAWLESSDGQPRAIHGTCSLGRAPGNSIVLDSPKVSRRHAMIHLQNIGEFWLIDLGSSNGTFLNKRRIHQPVRLTDGDQITIGDSAFAFRQPAETSEVYRTIAAQRTHRQMENLPCWLLVADVENFTPLSGSLMTEELASLLGKWIAACKEIIEKHGGAINKYLGDGFLAYWRDEEPRQVAAALAELKGVQARREPQFRIVVHFGSVAVGGMESMGEESLMGKEVNLVFRLEKLAGALGESCGLSDTAHEKLAELIPMRPLGEHELKGFEGKFAFFGAC